ncbi:PREDICTED: serine/threonine-protein phosphatase 6 regulatory subunit 3-like isoform X2 [Priapulus caudatus]|uniref:Serine/threonine-protein phosphatase 6 regulatory subunit 3-like isoform X2 n=1 Tax=Priapulus caudatus TaxID=37621 RepID=A0ABM1EXI1_PRICU|nr:PREDICTED: serine/threonine-protein phosphatase 6 regulatory subunit 3-like isoform X2 [Priapulus caudatus]
MFWRYNMMSTSHVDSLLDKENVTLQELMDEDDVLQECKAQNNKLIDFLIRPEIMEQMVNLIVTQPSDELHDDLKYKYPNLACELLTCDIAQINERLASEESLLMKLYDFIKVESPVNPLLASFFSKTFSLLVARQAEIMLDFFRVREDFLSHLLRHFDTSAVMDLLLRLVTCVEPTEARLKYVEWLSEQRVIQKLVDLIDPEVDEERQCNASQALSDMVKVIRDAMSQNQEKGEQDLLLNAIESQEVVADLLNHMFSEKRSNATLVYGMNVLLTLLNFKKIGPEGQQEQMTALDGERLAQGISNTLQALIPRLKDFHQLLTDPPPLAPMTTTVGVLDPPLGATRLQVAKLVPMLLLTNTHALNTELANLGTLSTMLDLFFKYLWNNFLHSHVEQCISFILMNNPVEIDGKQEHPLLFSLFKDTRIIQRIVDAHESNEQNQAKPGGRRAGYMGHLTRIANDIVTTLGSSSNKELIKEAMQETPDDYLQRWETFVTGALAEINKKNVPDKIISNQVHTSSEDDNADYKDIPFHQDTALQQFACFQSFNDYRTQQMTSNFPEQFGYSEEEFAEQEEHISAPLDKIPNLNFNISADEPPGNESLFDQIASARLQPFDDPDSDEEWEEKQITFSPDLQNNTASKLSSTIHTSSSSESDSSDCDDETSGPKQIVSKPSNGEERMEIEGVDNVTPNGDEVPMAVDSSSPWQPNANLSWESGNNMSNPFDSSTSSAEEELNDSTGKSWADFSNMDSSDSLSNSLEHSPRNSSPIEMDTEVISTTHNTKTPSSSAEKYVVGNSLTNESSNDDEEEESKIEPNENSCKSIQLTTSQCSTCESGDCCETCPPCEIKKSKPNGPSSEVENDATVESIPENGKCVVSSPPASPTQLPFVPTPEPNNPL